MRPRKRFGQHFLAPAWVEKLIAAIAPTDGDRFLEIGPGPGALTLRLAPRVAHLTAVEIDRELAAGLAPQLPPNVDLVVADFLALDLSALVEAGPIRVAGNLPYNISSPILFRLIEMSRRFAARELPDTVAARPHDPPTPRPREPATARPREPAILDATLMLQREVADRLVASPGTGDYGVLSISVQLYADVRRLMTLPPGAFRPPPKVHSAVVRLTFRPPSTPPRDEAVFHAMVRSMFTQRRKTLANALASFGDSRSVAAGAVLEAAGIDPVRRPETLDLAELTRLADRFVSGAGR
jgi:16S rRNA (adenine1518-N6/adenine1519-N6)-dimethyltransferase